MFARGDSKIMKLIHHKGCTFSCKYFIKNEESVILNLLNDFLSI